MRPLARLLEDPLGGGPTIPAAARRGSLPARTMPRRRARGDRVEVDHREHVAVVGGGEVPAPSAPKAPPSVDDEDQRVRGLRARLPGAATGVP